MATNTQALHEFMNSFGLTAYVEGAVPKNATLPYLTYNKRMGSTQIDVWENTQSELKMDNRITTIISAISDGGKIVNYTGGALYVTLGNPDWYKGATDDPKEKHTVININIEDLNRRY